MDRKDEDRDWVRHSSGNHAEAIVWAMVCAMVWAMVWAIIWAVVYLRGPQQGKRKEVGAAVVVSPIEGCYSFVHLYPVTY